MKMPTIAAITAALGIVVALSTLEARGWWPVTQRTYGQHVEEFASDRLDRLCKECRARCHRICNSADDGSNCLSSCLSECDQAECA